MSISRLGFLSILLVSTSVFGQDDDDEQPPGLRARYQVANSVVERIDPDLAFVWGSGSPDERLPVGPFSANWSGSLLLRSETNYRFHAFVQGQVKLTLNGQTVLEGTSDKPHWISGPETAFKFGDQPFELVFARIGDSAQLKLYWSSGEFPLEPVPYHALFQTKAAPVLSLIERGRVQFDAFRCGNCHSGQSPAGDRGQLTAPSLTHVGTGTSREWLVQKLMLGSDAAPKLQPSVGKMPHFGFNRDDADAIVATLRSKATPVDFIAAAKLKDAERAKDLQAGQTLVRSVGCLACHTWNSLSEETPYGGGSLDNLGAKRNADWLTTWLAEPARLNARHRMPVFNLTEKERSQIVLALADPTVSIPSPTIGKADNAVLARGTRLIETSRCANCHEIPGLKVEVPRARSLTDPKVNWSRGCTQPLDRAQSRPAFPHIDMKAVQAYVASWKVDDLKVAVTDPLVANSLIGQRLLQRKNCISCHDRDQGRGISRHAAAIAKSDEGLAGLQMTLIPPRLNAVGDRMHDAGLAAAIRGEQKAPRLNWLRVRMPKFAHSPTEQAALLNHLIGHDRIPDDAPRQEPIAPQTTEKVSDPQRILAGRELLGGKGFSCVACHAVKDYTPKVAALGTRGSNLHLIGQRMRTDYFFRWTRAPLRVMPGVEMPNYQRAHEFILPGQLDQQLNAIWEALNDPNLTAPSNPAIVEQLLAVGDQGPPRVVRDVFTVPSTVDDTVARAYAIGLPGGHSVLLDLDTCSVRGWTLGDFARQRCEGKRWYWDLAGTVLATRFDKRPDIILVHNDTGDVIAPETGWNVECRLHDDDRDDRSVSLKYEMTFSKDGVSHNMTVHDTFGASGTAEIVGWERRLSTVVRGPVWPLFRNATPETVNSQSSIKVVAPVAATVRGLPAAAVRFAPPNSENQYPNLLVRYETSLRWSNPIHNAASPLISRPDSITTVPGFRGQRLALPRSIMPTAMTWNRHGRLLFTSLKGHLYGLQESREGLPSLIQIDEGLAAPFGIIEAHDNGSSSKTAQTLVVAHKPELLQLNLDENGSIHSRRVVATGWGVTDDYHDWACGIVRDTQGNLFIGLGSDYTFKNRPLTKSRWRGDILRIDPQGKLESIARGLRYPTGLAIDDQDRLLVSDQQGVQNTFNELNFIQPGHRYGVPSRHEVEPNAPADPPAVQIPHPWTRSVNGIVCVPKSLPELAPFAGHFLGCEFNNNMLIRMSLQTVGNTVQGAVYPFSKPAKEGDDSNFVGPLCIGISPKGEIYVGSLQDGGWAGGLNMGDIVRLTPTGDLPNGLREIRATSRGFDLEFFHSVDPALAVQTSQYKISGYTRVWKGDYATPDSGHHAGEVTAAAISLNGRTVSLTVAGRKPGHVYDISIGAIGTESQPTLWPSIGHYTLHQIPE